MRWKSEILPRKQGTIRYKTKFLFLPITIRGETRWFENTTLRQSWESDGWGGGQWDTIGWCD